MFKKILIANRGEIAVRIIRTCREMGIASVAVYSDADRDALHVRLADEALWIGAGPATESYLNINSVLSAALQSGAEAIHPGYGFLAENADFADACVEANVVFIGPSSKILRLLGDKSAAKKIAEKANVPVVPGLYDVSSTDDLLDRVSEIGFPILIKAAFGGGGRGMRLVNQPSELSEALEGAKREALSSFGNDVVIVEKHLLKPRHIEVQIVGDDFGCLLSFGERECSVQRRYQKVIEETPSPAVNTKTRRAIEQSALDLASAVGYTNAGTVEFLLDSEGHFYFLEVNPRIQVEHPVTEWVTGLDLVRFQMLVAAGEPLPITQRDVVTRGHAIEARIYAEDPGAGYLPGAGSLIQFSAPSLPWVRHDVGVYKGFEIPVYYDSLLSKVSVYGQDRCQSTIRLKEALDGYLVAGVPTNLEMLKYIVNDKEFLEGSIDTDYVARAIEPALQSNREFPFQVLISGFTAAISQSEFAGYLFSNPVDVVSDVWHYGGPWRLSRQKIEYIFRYGDREFIVRGSNMSGTNIWIIDIADESFSVELSKGPDNRVSVSYK